LESLWEIIKGYRKAAGKCTNYRCHPIGEEIEWPSGYWQKCVNFHPFSMKQYISVYVYLKSQELWKILKTLSSSSPVFALSNHTTFSQTQTGATVPLSGECQEWVGALDTTRRVPGAG
jgi:hypothetical protein